MEITALVLPLAFGIASLLAWIVVSCLDRALRLPLGIYAGFYLLTTLIGATLIGLTQGEALDSLAWGIELWGITDFNSPRYWGLLFAPLLIPPLTILIFRDSRVLDNAVHKMVRITSSRVSIPSVLFVFLIMSGYCFVLLARAGYLGTISMWLTIRNDYVAMILLREKVIGSLGSVFFGLTYVALPTLSFIALHQAVVYRSWQWQATFGFTAIVTVVLNMELMQKSPVLLYLSFLSIGLLELKVIRLRSMILPASVMFACLTALQALMVERWALAHTFDLLLFRMAASYPFYVNLYPEAIPYSGIELGLHLIGLGEPARDNLDVFRYMYPTVTFVDGAAPSPAHVRAYSQGGLLYAVVTLVLVGLCLRAITTLRKNAHRPLTFAIYLESLVFLYYLTQTSMRESIISCYGIFWAVVAIGAVWTFAGKARPDDRGGMGGSRNQLPGHRPELRRVTSRLDRNVARS